MIKRGQLMPKTRIACSWHPGNYLLLSPHNEAPVGLTGFWIQACNNEDEQIVNVCLSPTTAIQLQAVLNDWLRQKNQPSAKIAFSGIES
jgi:hypothetical protein